MVGFAINSAADAIFKCVFGTATVAEEPRDCTVQSASAYKSKSGVAWNNTVLGMKQICSKGSSRSYATF